MAKQLIRLTESDLHRIIEESVNRVLCEIEEGAGWDVVKDMYHELKGYSPEQVAATSKDWKDDKQKFIKGRPDAQDYKNQMAARKEGSFADPYSTVASQPGWRGNLKRRAIAGVGDAMLGARKFYDKMKGRNNQQ